MRKISTAIITAITACVLIVSILVGSINGVLSYKTLEEEAEDKISAMSNQYANQMDLHYRGIQEIVSGMTSYFESISSVSKNIFKEIESLLMSFGELTDATSEGADGIQYISKNAEEVANHTREVELEANRLNQIAEELSGAIEVFLV